MTHIPATAHLLIWLMDVSQPAFHQGCGMNSLHIHRHSRNMDSLVFPDRSSTVDSVSMDGAGGVDSKVVAVIDS